MSLIVVGTNHKYSPIEIREKLSFSKKELKQALIILSESSGLPAAVIISTCNRIEVYADVADAQIGVSALKDFLSSYRHQELFQIEPYLYTYMGKEAVLHLFKVACGIDSQVIGERQILEQLSFAYQQAEGAGFSNGFLARIFTAAQDTARVIWSVTRLSEGNISLGSIAVNLLSEKAGGLKDKKILVIGTGKIAELVIRDLSQENTSLTLVANRNFKKAAALARYADAEVVKFSRLTQKLKDTDIIISATASPHAILKKEDFIGTKRPLLILDLALPRDVETEVKYIEGINLFCLDDLDSTVDKNLSQRMAGIPQAIEIIKEKVEKICLNGPLELEPELARLP